MGETVFDPAVALLVRFAELAVTGLGEEREAVDALNVFPVPDADTGTNMFLTLEAARDALLAVADGATPAEAVAAYARGALLGARGNSGVILSQLLGRALGRLVDDGAATPVALAEALADAADAAYAAVGEPVEGTVLTVARAAADEARLAADETGDAGATGVATVLRRAVAAARSALERTPEQLERLREAGVVDAGGEGLCLVLEAAERAVTGRRAPARARQPVPRPVEVARQDAPTGPAYEVMYLLDAAADGVPALRSRLGELGDSVVVVGDGGRGTGAEVFHVHAHVDDAGAAIEAGMAAGAPRRIRVTHLGETATAADGGGREQRRTGREVLAVSAGPGLAALFRECGAVVVEGGPGRRPTTAELLEAVAACGAAEVVVLPNDPESRATAEAVARQAGDLGVKVVVVPTAAQVQGIAALAVHDAGRGLESDVVAMTSAARHTRHGAVTLAGRRAMTSAGPCEPGDALGAIESDFVLVGDDVEQVSRGLLGRLLDNGGELVTLVPGADADGLAERVGAWVERSYPGVDVCVHEGGQERYLLLLGVE